MDTKTNNLLCRTEAARRLGVHPNTLYSWAQRGYVDFVEVSEGRVEYPEQSIEDLKQKLGL